MNSRRVLFRSFNITSHHPTDSLVRKTCKPKQFLIQRGKVNSMTKILKTLPFLHINKDTSTIVIAGLSE